MHHAYLYIGSLSLLPVLVHDARERFQFVSEHNPDVHVEKFEKFGIEEARALSANATLRSLSGRALYIIGVSQINTEAQQALLKLFEEPQQGAIFVLLAPHGAIIPTLRSRFLEYPEKLRENSAQKVLGSPVSCKAALGPDHFVQNFLSSSYKTRSAEITEFLKDDEGERERVRDFLATLEQLLHTQLEKSKGKAEIRLALEDIAKVRSYANDRSPSMKMLLEHLAVSLPVLK